jgi:hypothetical protein
MNTTQLFQFRLNGLETFIRNVNNDTTIINLQKYFTPWELCRQMLEQLPKYVNLPESNILTFNIEYVTMLVDVFNVPPSKITFVTDCHPKAKFAREYLRFKGLTIYEGDYLSSENKLMKFDVIVGNPPYQTKSDADNRKTQAIWDKFVQKSFELCKDGGYVCLVHPSGWRDVKGMFEETKELLQSKDIKYLELHNEADGLTTFGAETRYDWYVSQNRPCCSDTTVKGQDGMIIKSNISKLPFIPNGMFEKIKDLIATGNDKRVTIINNSSYHHQRHKDGEWMSKEKTSKYKYPCIYSIDFKGNPKFWWSSTNKRGHFDIPKVIFASGRISSANYIIDNRGEYAMTEFATGIVDEPKNLSKIKDAMLTSEFKNLMEMCAFRYDLNKNIISTFKRDFWKEFVK